MNFWSGRASSAPVDAALCHHGDEHPEGDAAPPSCRALGGEAMSIHRTAVPRLLPVLVVALVLAGCGSSSPNANAGATSSSAGGGSSAASTPSDSAPSTPAVTGDDFCAKIVSAKTQLTTNEMPALLRSGTPAAWKKYLEATAAMNDSLYAAAPDEIKSAVDQLRQVNVKLTAVLSAANYDITKVTSTEILHAITSADYKKASADFAAYVKSHCSLDLTKP
jgi:hypothetical protein